MKKVIVVFANSVKHRKHCVAGKDIETGKWIRPVADANGKELKKKQCMVINPYGEFMVNPLQKVEIELVKSSPLPNQPENFIVGGAQWVQRYNIKAHEVDDYLDEPEMLWETGDRVAYSEIESGAIRITQSLYLVKIDNLRIYKNDRNKRRASFSYKGNHYDLPVTVPHSYRQLQTPQHQSILCVSLGEKFNGFCYKIVAAIYGRE
uniref:Dual OB-containing domain-containing protein n=1 Tax=Candidatus Kentrum sp. UNK TaxID=2126344 RepID=A0A451A4Y3_9GAMM|nr:MAG: hypothetical protein BECKUNK1418G_GA0071005_101532 [Candidatus Kentron sp. UNK]VFK69570.1 MAG: hypothetical protein BECKUNK1418H_GA0071006_10166 [Candidatus Kentron sp. UNK]